MSRSRVHAYVDYLMEEVVNQPASHEDIFEIDNEDAYNNDYEEDAEEELWDNMVDDSTRIDHYTN